MKFSNEKYNNVLTAIAIMKLWVLFFILIIFTNKLYQKYSLPQTVLLGNVTLFDFFSIIILLLIVYLIWSLIYIRLGKNSPISMQLIEDFIFTVCFSMIIFLSGTYQSQYKYLFFFSIISTAICSGKKQGLTVASISSGIMLSTDLIYAPNSPINVYFQNDLILAALFVFVACILGEYVKYEKDQREALEGELIEQLKHHDYIEEMILRNEACYDLLIKRSADAICIHDFSGLKYLNENALKLVGVSSLEKLKGKSIIDFDYTDNKYILRERYLDILKNKRTEVSFEQTIVNKEGESVHIQNMSTYCVYGKTPAILTIMRDITPRKQIEILKGDVKKNIQLLNKSQEHNRFITEFFANISHELKTPLNVIFSSLQLLILHNENCSKEYINKKKKYLDSMKQNCYRLMRLINNILDMTKLDAGFIKPQMQNRDIVSIVEEITMSVIPYAEDKGISIIFDTDFEEKIIAFDPDKIERIILNLLSNALKFTNKKGEILVCLTEEDNNIVISVKDTGIGIPKDKQEMIFERFIQVDKTLRRNSEGSGIGLSLVKSFVKLHNGEIKLKSELDKGSEFIISLPAQQVQETIVKSSEIINSVNNKVIIELSDLYSNNL